MINIGLVQFRWGVAASGGYEWRRASDGGLPLQQALKTGDLARATEIVRVPVELLPREEGVAVNWYAPLTEQPQLYRTFAEVEPSEDGFREFAEQYGLLRKSSHDGQRGPETEKEEWYHRNGIIEHPSVTDARERTTLASANTFEAWREEWEHLTYVVQLYDLASTGTTKAGPSGRSPRIALERSVDGVDWRDLLVGAEGRRALNKTVLGRARLESPEFLLNFVLLNINQKLASEQTADAVYAQLLYTPDRGPSECAFSMHIVPSNLVGAMWLQFARELAERPEYRRCPNCSKWFEISPDGRGKRTNAKFCTSRCQVAKWKLEHPKGKHRAPKTRSSGKRRSS